MVSAEILAELERYGVHAVHFELLARALRLQRSGSIRWRWHDGRLCACDLHVSVPARDHVVQEVCTLWDGAADSGS